MTKSGLTPAFRIYLRVEQPQDSHDVLKRPDAASLVGRGQGYLQVGHDEVFTLFQSAWGGAAYQPNSAASDPHELCRSRSTVRDVHWMPVVRLSWTPAARTPRRKPLRIT